MDTPHQLIGFQLETHLLAIDQIMPSKKLPEGIETTRKFAQLMASLKEIGLIEPLSVIRTEATSEQFMLLDGHMRMLAFKALGEERVPCLIATDDEAYTYNNRINRLSTVQEHYMVRRAIDRGVPKERLARALNLDIRSIDRRLSLLNGVCAAAVVLLQDKQFNPELARILRKLRPERQVEVVELMIAANALTVSYAEALFNATPPEQQIKPKRRSAGITDAQMAKLEREMEKVQDQYQTAEKNYGEGLLNFTVAKGFVSRLIDNPAVENYLSRFHPEIHAEFKQLAAAESMEQLLPSLDTVDDELNDIFQPEPLEVPR